MTSSVLWPNILQALAVAESAPQLALREVGHLLLGNSLAPGPAHTPVHS